MLRDKPALQPIENQRIRLRLLSRDDLEMTRNWRNQDSIRKWFVHSDVITPEHHQQWFESYLTRDNDFVFIIEDKETLRRPVGQIALYNIEWQQRRAEFGRLMIGDPEAQGKGFAKAASALLVRFAKKTWSIREIYLDVYANNYPAINIYESTGFTPATEFNGMMHMVWEKSDDVSDFENLTSRDSSC